MATELAEMDQAVAVPLPPIDVEPLGADHQASDRLAVIVPVYNEQATVAELLRRLEEQSVVSQIIIVDDGSTDRTWEVLTPWRVRTTLAGDGSKPTTDTVSVIVVQHEKNRGKGRAIRTALEHVTCSHVLIQDADLEYDPADIANLWQEMQSGNADVVFGSRYLNTPELQQGRYVLQSGVRFLNLLVRLLYGVKLTDEATCYKMFRVGDLRRLRLTCEQFEFCPEVTAKAAQLGLRFREVKVQYSPRTVDDGKKIRFRDAIDAVWVLMVVRFSNWQKPTPAISAVPKLFQYVPAVLASLVLVVAATLKLTAVAKTGLSSVNSGILAATEGVVALWLASGVFPRIANAVVVFMFLLFSIYAFFLGISGASECGCFGIIAVSPWLAFGVDVVVLATWLAFPGIPLYRPQPSLQVPWYALILVAVVAACAVGNSTAGVVSQALTGRKLNVLQPATWVGERCLILDSASIGDKLAVDEWVVVLHRSGCSACRALHDEYQNLGLQLGANAEQKVRIAFIEVGYPDAGLSNPDRQTNGNYEIGWLDETIDWVAPTPTVLHLSDGIVTAVEEYAKVGSSARYRNPH